MAKVVAPAAPKEKEKKDVPFGEVRVEGFDTDTGELLIRVDFSKAVDFEAFPLSKSGLTRRLTNGAMSSIGTFHGDVIPAGIAGHNLRIQVGVYADVE
jgi:hypothetical protein